MHVRAYICENTVLSTWKRSNALDLPGSSLIRILLKELDLRSYKIQMVQNLKPLGHAYKLQFAKEMKF